MAAKKKAKPAKINPEDFGFDESQWAKMDQRIRSWIVLNKELWKGLSKYQQDAVKASTDFAKNAKVASETAKETSKNAEDLSKSLKNSSGSMKKIASSRAAIETMGAKILVYDQESDALSKRRVKSITGIVDISADYMANMDAIGTDEFRSLDFNKQIREAIKAKLPEEVAYLRKLKAEHDIQKKLNAEINAQSDLIKKPFNDIDGIIKNIPFIGELLSSKLDLKGKGENMAEKFTEAVKGGAADLESGPEKKGGGLDMRFKKNKEFVKSQGKSAGLMKKMGPAALAVGAAVAGWAVSAFKFAAEMGVAFSQITPAMLLFKDQTKAMLDEFGSVDDVSAGMLWSMKKASFFSGVQAGDMAKMAMLQTSITGDTKEMALDKQAAFMKQIKKEGLSAAKVMGDLAGHADMFANFAKDGGKNMEEAAKQAAAMGLTLDATEAVAESLLDWETSIAAEQEASMILGRSINLDKARQLAYDGKLVPMMEEAKRQAGGEAEFAKMSVVQRQALGAAIGLQGAQLGKFMKTEEGAADKSGKAWYKSFWAIAALLTVVGGLVGMILGGLAPWKLITMGAGAAWGAGIGAGIGLIGAGMISSAGDMFSPAKGRTQVSPKEGGLYNLSKNDDLMAGPGIASGGGAPVVNVDTTEMVAEQKRANDLAQKRYEQAEMHSKKAGRDVTGAFAQR
jgi:hypothetical protein